ncbi:MAG: YggS family pyridoxal phosphate-dependent enzyme [Lewinellaceae bacterium]|nr:YggS family pyridoxal phosphate-dependent enzyme [Phaeodactylibacter sp.]MCB9040793.1 YggS family pyridoxal phosphate-dependent enzyme [Lewinellaceae bacterium]
MKELQDLLKELEPTQATLVAVSKTHPPEKIMELYQAGQRDFGENRVQEMIDKYEQMPKDIRWHLIGHLQTNKVKYITSWVHLIHSVDSFKVLKEIDKRAAQDKRVVDCLLQFKIAEEDTKYGFEPEEAYEMLRSDTFKNLKNIRIAGVMGMATFTDNEEQVRREFQQLRKIFQYLKDNFFANQDSFREISMGMSDDYKIALEEGSTMVRIGSLLFGEREYG